MGKHEKAEVMHQVYREFSRQKYNKYKHQYPKMRESEIVSKIIREWDSLGAEGKEKLHRLYENNKFIREDPSEQESGYKSVQKIKTEKCLLENTNEKSTGVKMEHKEQDSRMNEVDKYTQSEHGSSKKSIDSSQLLTPQSRSKKTFLNARNDYLAFFKYYFERYKKEHERWSSKQISKVIALMWAKRKRQYKIRRIKKQKPQKHKKTVNGRRFFRRVKKLDAQEVKTQWNHLPRQSRLLWSYPNKQIPNPPCRMQGKMVFKSSSATDNSNANTLSFLNLVMK